jgi:hypothetical protein
MSRKWLDLPSTFNPIDCTVDEAASFRRESRRTTHEKIKDGRYESYLEGRIRKIVFASVLAHRERAIAESRKPPETGKRRVGRPRLKPRPAATPAGIAR